MTPFQYWLGWTIVVLYITFWSWIIHTDLKKQNEDFIKFWKVLTVYLDNISVEVDK